MQNLQGSVSNRKAGPLVQGTVPRSAVKGTSVFLSSLAPISTPNLSQLRVFFYLLFNAFPSKEKLNSTLLR